ncbi:hypothetical protein CCACVL1_10651 [Corchorus capsularis]|uniref:Uncharacterized protein n=1 Tax=Corchorus capsularis TaxID=210143 RepID=A0A1R3IQF7_COCAP|nr:hypothetical protein CCACVL1_10651 [Corchorus capsularis]
MAQQWGKPENHWGKPEDRRRWGVPE